MTKTNVTVEELRDLQLVLRNAARELSNVQAAAKRLEEEVYIPLCRYVERLGSREAA